MSLVPAVHMYEDSSFVGVFILLEQGVYLVTSLFQAANLVERDRTAHAGFPFAVFQVFIVPYTVFGILMIMWTLAPFIMRLRASRSTMS